MQLQRLILFMTVFILGTSRLLFADRYLVEAKIGHYHPYSDTLTELYDDEWDDYSFEISYSPFNACYPRWWGNFFIFGSYDYIFNSGFTFSGLEDTRVRIQFYTFSLGLKYICSLPWNFDLYGSIGPRYIFLRADNRDDETVTDHDRAKGLGGVAALGFLFHPIRWLTIDFFSTLMFKRFNESHFSDADGSVPQKLDISGVTIGIGAGIRF